MASASRRGYAGSRGKKARSPRKKRCSCPPHQKQSPKSPPKNKLPPNIKPKRVTFSYPRGRFPRLVLIGNSNVGKSSLTKLLLTDPKRYTGKVGKTPGSTIKLNLIDDRGLPYQIVDLPGFGKMVKIYRDKEARVQEQILDYFIYDKKSIFLTLVVVSAVRLIDEMEKYLVKRSDTIPLTIEFIKFLDENEIPCVIVLNKIDKLNIYERKRVREMLSVALMEFGYAPDPEAATGLLDIFEISARTGECVKALKSYINEKVHKLDFSEFDDRDDLGKKPSVKELYQKKL